MSYIDLILDFTVGVPLSELGNRLGQEGCELQYDEAVHPCVAQNQIKIIPGTSPEHTLQVVVLRDSAAQDDTCTVSYPVHGLHPQRPARGSTECDALCHRRVSRLRSDSGTAAEVNDLASTAVCKMSRVSPRPRKARRQPRAQMLRRWRPLAVRPGRRTKTAINVKPLENFRR